ncbi:MAG: hypothetical protein VB106_01845 [Clostridiaceae bacterium]|nr:hypothetical protein [Clostridiaceae bacterium]
MERLGDERFGLLEKAGETDLKQSALALVGISRSDEKDISQFTDKALRLTSEMNYVHDFLMLFEIYQPVLYRVLEKA